MDNNVIENNEKRIDNLYILASLLPVLYTVILFVLSVIDNYGCDGLFGGLSGSCHSTTFFIWAFLSIPFALISLFSLTKNTIPSVVGAVLFIIFNIFVLMFSDSNAVIFIELISIIFSIYIIVISSKYYEYKRNNKGNDK